MLLHIGILNIYILYPFLYVWLYPLGIMLLFMFCVYVWFKRSLS